MSYSMLNEALASSFCLLISWSFGVWVYYEWRNYEIKSKATMAIFLALVIAVAGSIFPVYFLSKCYYHYVLRHFSPSNVQQITIGNTVLTGDITPLISTLNDCEWFVPKEQVGWSKLVREGGVPLSVMQNDGKEYKFKVGYYFLGDALIRFPTGGYALSRNLAKILEDKGTPLP
jgi:hypothetical protein